MIVDIWDNLVPAVCSKVLSSEEVKMPFDARGQIAIITGSAQGFGKEFAKRLLRKGAKVCLSDVNEEVGAQTLEELEKTYGAKNVTFKR